MWFPRCALGKISIGWLLAGFGLPVCCLGWTLLSSQFEFGQGHAQRPILEFLGVYAAAWMCFVGGFLLLKRAEGKGPLGWILLVALLARALLLPSQLIQENDVYRYVLDGQVMRWGGNPYQFSPLVVSDLAADPFRRELMAAEAKGVVSRIGYPEISTVYPPAAQVVFALGAYLTGWDWKGQRWVFLVVDLCTIGLLLWLLSSLSMQPSWVLLYAWNPLVLKEIVNSVHLDGLVALWLLVAVLGFVRFERSKHLGWVWFSGIALGAATLSKIYPVIFLPAGYLFVQRHSLVGRARAMSFVLAWLLIVVIGLVPFLDIGWERLTEGVDIYARKWTMNEGAFGLLGLLTGSPRFLSALLILAICLGIPLIRASRTASEVAVDCHWVLLFWFLLLPSPFPWYAVPLMALLPITTQAAPLLAAGIGLSGLLGLYYLHFFYEYHDMNAIWWTATKGVEHGLAWILLLAAVTYPTVLGLKKEQ